MKNRPRILLLIIHSLIVSCRCFFSFGSSVVTIGYSPSDIHPISNNHSDHRTIGVTKQLSSVLWHRFFFSTLLVLLSLSSLPSSSLWLDILWSNVRRHVDDDKTNPHDVTQFRRIRNSACFSKDLALTLVKFPPKNLNVSRRYLGRCHDQEIHPQFGGRRSSSMFSISCCISFR